MQWLKLILNNLIKSHVNDENYKECCRSINIILDHLNDKEWHNYWDDLGFKLGVLYHVNARVKSLGKISTSLLAEILMGAIVVSDKVNTEHYIKNKSLIQQYRFSTFLGTEDFSEAVKRLSEIESDHLQAINWHTNTTSESMLEVFEKYADEKIRCLFLREAETYKYFEKDDNTHLSAGNIPRYPKGFSSANKTALTKILEKLKSFDATTEYLSALLDRGNENKTLSLAEVLNAINYSRPSIVEFLFNHVFMYQTIKVCEKFQLSEADFLKGLILLSQKRSELLDINRFFPMLFGYSIKRKTVLDIVSYCRENNLIDNEMIHKINVDLISSENIGLFFDIFKDDYKHQPITTLEKISETFRNDQVKAKFIEMLCVNLQEENDIENFLINISKKLPINCVQTAVIILKFSPKTLQNDKDFVNSLLVINQDAFQYASLELRDNKTFIIKKIVSSSFYPSCLSIDEHSIEAYLNKKGFLFKYASENLKSDKEFVQKVISQAPELFKYASDSLRNDEEFILSNSYDRRNCIKNIFPYASETIKNKKEFVLKILNKYWFLIQYVSDKLKEDSEVALLALTKNIHAWKYISINLRYDKAFVLNFLSQWNGESQEVLTTFLSHVNEDADIVFSAIKNNSLDYVMRNFASKKLHAHKEFALRVVNQWGEAYQYFSEDLRKEPEIALVALKTNPRAIISLVPKNLLQNKTFILDFIAQWNCRETWLLNNYVEHFNNDPDVVIAVIKKVPEMMCDYASENLKKNESFILKAVQINKKSLKYVPKQFENNEKVVKIALEVDPQALKYASEDIKKNKDWVAYALWQMGKLNLPSNEKITIRFFSSFISIPKNRVTSKELHEAFGLFLQMNDAQQFLESTFDISSSVFYELKKSSSFCLLQ